MRTTPAGCASVCYDRNASCLPKGIAVEGHPPRECTGSSSSLVRELLSHLLISLSRLRAKWIISDLPLAGFSLASMKTIVRTAKLRG